MALPAEVVRKLTGFLLELEGVELDPSTLAAWRESNTVQRALAHLLGYDGSKSRPVKVNADGKLVIADPTVAGSVSVEPGASALDVNVGNWPSPLSVHESGTVYSTVSGDVGLTSTALAALVTALTSLQVVASIPTGVELGSTTISALAAAIADAIAAKVTITSGRLQVDDQHA